MYNGIGMATKETYDLCIKVNKRRGRRGFDGSFKPDLKALFGVKKLVDKGQLHRCSESEKRRHLWEDGVLRSLYIE